MPQVDPLRVTAEIIIRAVREGDGAKVANGVAFYEQLVASFVEEVRRYGVVFNEQLLRQDLLGWTTFNDIAGQIRRFFDAAIESGRIDFVREAERLAFGLATYGVDQREYLSFKTAIDLLASVFWRTLDTPTRLREHGRGHTRQLIKDIVRFKLEPALQDDAVEGSNLQGFVKVVLQAHQNIMAWGIEHRDAELFRYGLADLEDVLRWGGPRDRFDSVIVLQDDLNSYELRDARELVKLGIGVRLLLELEKSADGALMPIAKSLLDSLARQPALTKLVLKALEGDVAHSLGWDWWDLVPDQVGAVRTEALLAHLYVFAALRSPASESPPHGQRSHELLSATQDVTANITSPVNQFMFDALSSIPQATQELKAQLDSPQSRLGQLEQALAGSVRAQERSERDQRIRAPLSEQRMEALRDEIREKSHTADALGAVFEQAKRIVFDDHCRDDDLLQATAWTARGAFAELPGWASLGGWELALEPVLARRKTFAEGMRESPSLDCESTAAAWDDVATCLGRVRAKADTRLLIVFVGEWRLYRMDDNRFQREWETQDDPLKGTQNFEGRFQDIPVLHFMDEGVQSIFVCSVDRHGYFRDCRPAPGQQIDVFVDGFNDDEARSLLAKSEPLMRNGVALTEDEGIAEIMDRVRIRVIFGTHYVVEDRAAGGVLNYPVDTLSG